MQQIELLEFGGGGFAVRHHGSLTVLRDPRDMHFQAVLLALRSRVAPGMPDTARSWQVDIVFDRWRAAWDLPEYENANRLAYLVDHFRSAISHDLSVYTHYDLGALWRGRRWTLLLDILDRLPPHSQFAAALAMDEEHAELLAKSLAERQESGESDSRTPSLTTWTPEVSMLASVIDAVNGVMYAVVSANSEKRHQPPEPYPRPKTALQRVSSRVSYRRRETQHQALAKRMLPHKARAEDPLH